MSWFIIKLAFVTAASFVAGWEFSKYTSGRGRWS